MLSISKQVLEWSHVEGHLTENCKFQEGMKTTFQNQMSSLLKKRIVMRWGKIGKIQSFLKMIVWYLFISKLKAIKNFVGIFHLFILQLNYWLRPLHIIFCSFITFPSYRFSCLDLYIILYCCNLSLGLFTLADTTSGVDSSDFNCKQSMT